MLPRLKKAQSARALLRLGRSIKLVLDYYGSPEFLGLARSTQTTYRSVINRVLKEEQIGHRLVREMTRSHVRQILARRSSTPGAANSLLKRLKVLLHFAIDNDWRKDDPTVRIKAFPSGEHHTWTEEEIARYEARWHIGTRPRLAFALLLYTGQRISDVSSMSRLDLEDDAIQVTPLKTKNSTGKKLWIPVHPELGTILEASELGSPELLMTSFGKRFSTKGFGNYMADRIRDAGLPDRCVAHGLRKAAARRLAESGCSANEIQSITGHATLAEVSRYTRAAEQRALAKTAIKRLADNTTPRTPQMPNGAGGSSSRERFPKPSPRFGDFF